MKNVDTIVGLKVIPQSMLMGNFHLKERETPIVTDYLLQMGVPKGTFTVNDYSLNRDDADQLVKFDNGKIMTFEVKEQSYANVSKTNNIPIDIFSAFTFKDAESKDYFKNNQSHPAVEFHDFKESMDKKTSYKKGTIFKTKADVWLTAAQAPNGRYLILTGYDLKKMRDPLIMKIYRSLSFRVNNKSKGLGKKDNYESAFSICKLSDMSDWEIKDKDELLGLAREIQG